MNKLASLKPSNESELKAKKAPKHRALACISLVFKTAHSSFRSCDLWNSKSMALEDQVYLGLPPMNGIPPCRWSTVFEQVPVFKSLTWSLTQTVSCSHHSKSNTLIVVCLTQRGKSSSQFCYCCSPPICCRCYTPVATPTWANFMLTVLLLLPLLSLSLPHGTLLFFFIFYLPLFCTSASSSRVLTLLCFLLAIALFKSFHRGSPMHSIFFLHLTFFIHSWFVNIILFHRGSVYYFALLWSMNMNVKLLLCQ